jgi:hypothetical protein
MTIRNPKLNKGQIKAYADKFRDDWYANLVRIDNFNHESNIKHKNECLNAFADMVLRQDLPPLVYAGACKMIKEAEGRINDSELREFIPNFQSNHRRRINESSLAGEMRKAFENELLINPYMTQDEIYAFAQTHWQLYLLRENLAEDWAAYQEDFVKQVAEAK